jgi:hypothetical protein
MFRLGRLAGLVKLSKQPRRGTKVMAPEMPSWMFASFYLPFSRCGIALSLECIVMIPCPRASVLDRQTGRIARLVWKPASSPAVITDEMSVTPRGNQAKIYSSRDVGPQVFLEWSRQRPWGLQILGY